MMTTQTDYFEAYVARTTPHWLRDDSPPPDEIPPPLWASIVGAARAYHRQRAAYAFAKQVAAKGFHPHELATGDLDRGSEVGLLDGSVRRPLVTTPPELRQRAEALWRRLHDDSDAARLMDVGLRSDLDFMARGRGETDPRRAELVFDAARRAIAEAGRDMEEARQTAAQQPVINVLQEFTALGGRTFSPGRYRVTSETLAALEDWREKMDIQRQRYSGNTWRGPWPPYVIV